MGFRQIFEADNNFHIDAVHKVEETLEMAQMIKPDLVILDIDATVDLSLLRNLNHLVPDSRVVLWVGAISPEIALQSVNLGVVAIVPKTAEPHEFLTSIRQVQAGGTSVERSLIQGVSNTSRVHLSKRESELVTLIAQGLRNKEIAARLSITENTVKAYLSRLFEKVKVDDRLGLALYGLTNQTADVQALRAKVGSRPEMDLPKNDLFKTQTVPGSERFAPVHP
jgi:DNA-binding NarL/FixJ family response regulator